MINFACLLVFTLLTLLASCATPSLPSYTSPAVLTPENAGSIAGSITVDPNPVVSNTHVLLVAVDNLETTMGRNNVATPILVAPGQHLMTIALLPGIGLFTNEAVGRVTLFATIKPGIAYTLRSTVPTSGMGFSSVTATVWIEDSTGATVTPRTEFRLDKYASIPIFIPVPGH